MKPAMRIAVDASSLLTRHPRGEGRSLLRLYEEIARIRPGWRFIFLGMRESAAAAEIRRRVPGSEIRIFDLPGYRWNVWKNLGLPLAAWLMGAELLHCASSGAPPWSPVPVVMTVHDLIPLLMDDGTNASAVRRFRRGLAAGVRLARKIITVSNHTRQDLMRLMGPDPEKVAVVHWGTDVPSPPADTAGHPDDLVLAFGGGSKRKNTPLLIRTFAQVAAGRPSAKLHILGVSDASQRAELQALVEELALGDRVSLLEYVSDAVLERYYSRASCMVYISLYEGFGLPPLEAMAHGVPVVAANRSSIPEVVGDAGILVDPERSDDIAEAVLRVLRDRELRRELSQRALRQARAFSWREAAEKTVAQFEAALAPQP